jgi:hypothetical protein
MSTIKVTNIQSNAVATTPVVKDSAGTEVGQFCKAWVNFNGTGTVAIRDSFNVSSITDNGTGDYTVNFTIAMSSVNYAASVIAFSGAGTTGKAIRNDTVPVDASSFIVKIRTLSGSALEDTSYVLVSIFSN